MGCSKNADVALVHWCSQVHVCPWCSRCIVIRMHRVQSAFGRCSKHQHCLGRQWLKPVDTKLLWKFEVCRSFSYASFAQTLTEFKFVRNEKELANTLKLCNFKEVCYCTTNSQVYSFYLFFSFFSVNVSEFVFYGRYRLKITLAQYFITAWTL